jgi:hypothetical protein
VREELARSLSSSPSAASTPISPFASLIKEESGIKLVKSSIKLEKSSIKSEEKSILEDFNGELDLRDSFQSPRSSAKVGSTKKETPTQVRVSIMIYMCI